MNIQQCLDRLANGELVNTTFVCDDQISDTKVPFIISLINEALLRLYSRFILKEDYALIELNELRTTYYLDSSHAYDLSVEKIPKSSKVCLENYDKYIFASKDRPFTNNVIKILRVCDSSGNELPLNNSSNPLSVFTPTYNSIQIANLDIDGALAVTYQAKHPEVTIDNLEMNLELPESFYGAFFAYIANLAYSSLQTELAMASAQKYFSIYTALLDELVTYDLGNSSYSQTNTKFYKNGWC